MTQSETTFRVCHPANRGVVVYGTSNVDVHGETSSLTIHGDGRLEASVRSLGAIVGTDQSRSTLDQPCVSTRTSRREDTCNQNAEWPGRRFRRASLPGTLCVQRVNRMKPTKWCISCKKKRARPGEYTCQTCADRQAKTGDAFRK